MAKKYKLTKNGETIYPCSTTDAIVNPNTKKTVTEELEGLKKYSHKVADKPYIYGRYIDKNSGEVKTRYDITGNVSCFCLLIDVSNIKTISINKSIYTSMDGNQGGVIFLGSDNSLISSIITGVITKAEVPDNAVIAAINMPTVDDIYYSIEIKDDTLTNIDNDCCIVSDVWDGTNYNVGWWGINTLAELLVTMSKNTIVNSAYYENNFYSVNGDKSDILSWVGAESNSVKEYYIKNTSTEEYIYEFDEPVDEILDVFIYPNQTGWNNGCEVYDNGGNTIHTEGRQNSLSQFKVPVGAKQIKLIDPSHNFNGKIYLYSKSELANDDKTINKLNKISTKNICAGTGLTVDEESNKYSITTNFLEENKTFVVLNVPVEPNKEYVIFATGSLISGTSKRNVPLVALDENYNLVKAYTKEDVDYEIKASSFIPNLGTVFKFTTPGNASFVTSEIYAANEKANIEELNAVLCEYGKVRAAIDNGGVTPDNNYELTGEMLSSLKQKTDVVIWNLGDSTSQTGYGGTLASFEGDGGGAWVKYFIDNVKPKAFYNYAAGGYTVTDSSTSFVDGIIQGAEKSYIKKIEDAITDYQNGTIKAPDYLLIIGCTNDFGKTRSNPNGWSNRSFVKKEDLSSETLNPNGWDYDEFMEYIFIREEEDQSLKPIQNVPMFKLAGAIRYIVERISKLFPNCKFMIASSIPAPYDWLGQNSCHKEMKWIANRLSIPYIDVNESSNICMLNDIKTKEEDGSYIEHRRFIADGYHPYGQYDTQQKSYITAGAMYHGKYIAEVFRRYIAPISIKEIEVVDWIGGPGDYPHSANINV